MKNNQCFKKILLILFSILSVCISAQSITWQKCYKSPFVSDKYYGEDIIPSDNGNFFIIGTVQNTVGAYLIKINAFGDSIFSKFFPNISASTGISTFDGGCVFAGAQENYPQKLYLMRINSTGNIVWYNTYDSISLAICRKLIRTTDNKYVVCGKINYDFGFIAKFDSIGNFVWKKTYSDIYYKELFSVIEAIDSGYIAVGNSSDGQLNYGVSIKIDIFGNVLWEKKYRFNNYGLDMHSINKLNDKYIMLFGARDTLTNNKTPGFHKTDLNGNILLYRIYPGQSLSYYYTVDSKIINENKYLFCFNRIRLQYDSTLGSAMFTDSLGNILKYKEFIGTDYIYLRRITLTNNGDILFIGGSNHLNPDLENAYVIRADSNLYTSPVSINYLFNYFEKEFELFQNYPNPFNPITKISYDLPKDSKVSLVIYDILCREITRLINSEFKQAGSYIIDFNGSYLASGVYFYRIEAGSFNQVKKMVLIK